MNERFTGMLNTAILAEKAGQIIFRIRPIFAKKQGRTIHPCDPPRGAGFQLVENQFIFKKIKVAYALPAIEDMVENPIFAVLKKFCNSLLSLSKQENEVKK